MSKERARRRVEREAAAALARERSERLARRRRSWAALRARVVPRRTPARRPRDSALARQRARQNGVLAAVVVASHTVLWLLSPSWWLRGGAVLLTLLMWPVLLVVLFDRRPTV